MILKPILCTPRTVLLIGLAAFGLTVGCASRTPEPVAAPVAAPATIAARPEQLQLEQLKFAPKKPEQWQLSNGMKVYYLQSTDVPMMRGQLYIPGGSLFDAPDKIGVAEAVGSQMREGGIPGTSPDEVDRFLDAKGATIETGYGGEFGSASFSCLEEDFGEVFMILGRMVREPSFDRRRLNLWKKLVLEAIARRKDDPGTIAGLVFAEALYSGSSPYGRVAKDEDVKRIGLADMRKFHARFARPDGSRLVITGSAPRAVVEQQIERVFGSWKPGKDSIPAIPEAQVVGEPGYYVVQREFDQSSIIAGHEGPSRKQADPLKVGMFNRIFGGSSMASTLFSEIRTKLGLAYSVSGILNQGTRSGLFQISIGTRNDEALRAMLESVKLVQRSRVEEPTQMQFSDAVSAAEKGFVFKFETPSEIANRAAILELLEFPPDLDETYLERIGQITPLDIRKIADTWLMPEKLRVVLVGNVSPADVKKAVGPNVKVFPVQFSTHAVIGTEVK